MEMIEVPDPKIVHDTDVLIKMQRVGVCGSDIHYYATGKIGSQVVEYPFAVGHEGAGIFPVRSHANIQGACDMGVLPDFLPGYRAVSDSESREMFEKAWGHSIPDTPGLTLTEMIPAIEEKKIKQDLMNKERSYSKIL